MILLIKLFLAHLIGDFLLQPNSWIIDKDLKKAASKKLYLHLLIHGLLVSTFLWSIDGLVFALVLMVVHGIIDSIKLYAQQEKTKVTWFLIDQGLHLLSIVILWIWWFEPVLSLLELFIHSSIWIYGTALIFLTFVCGIAIQVLMTNWSKSLKETNEDSLSEAGKYIGILERLFVFTFVVTGNWEAIGFLLATKSVFRFGDLKESKDRKLTEYMLIGTLLSFGLAIFTGMAVIKLLE
jgi:hypothetical protein